MVFKLMPICMASHKPWGSLLPVHLYTNISHMCMHKACINLCGIYKIYTYTYMFIYNHIPTLTTEFTCVTVISFMPNYYCCPYNYMILVPKLGTFLGAG